MRVPLCFLGVLTSAVVLAAQKPQQPAPDVTFRASTEVLTIDAIVTDRDGQPVTDLTREDFEVTVAGKRQKLDQAIYIRTQEQPQVLAAARAAAVPNPSGPAVAPAGSMASRALKATGASPDRVARTIAIVVDDLGLSFRAAFDVRNAVHRYIDTQIEPGDLVAIIRTAGGVGTLQQFTTDKRLLHLAADRLQWDFRSRKGLGEVGAFAPENKAGDDRGGDTVDELHDSLASVGSLGALEFIARGVSELPGRKCVILFSEGFNLIFNDRQDGSSRIWRAMTRMLSRANAAGVVINTIDARGLTAGGLPGPRVPNSSDWRTRDGFRDPSISLPEGTSAVGSGNGYLDAPGHTMGAADRTNGRAFIGSQESLSFIADQTGGIAFRDSNDLNLGMQRVLDDQKGYYLLGYTAAADAPRRGWDQDRVKVHVKRRGLHVRARQGFFGPSDTRHPQPAPADPLVMSALSPFESGGITVRLTSVFGYDATTRPYVRSLLFIDPGDVHFDADETGRHTARFQVLLMAIGDNGQLVDSWRREVPLALTDENFRLLSERGIVVTVRSAVKEPGPYQMRVAVEDLASKAVGSASQFLEVPEVGGGRLALSGVLLKGTTGAESTTIQTDSNPHVAPGLADTVLLEPEVRVLSPGVEAVYLYEIYDVLKDADPALEMSAAVIRDGKVVYQGPFTPVKASPKSGDALRTIPIAGRLTLGRDMPAGPYTLEVIVRGRDGKKLERRQWVDFEVRP
jgi:VWFA-related protein